MSTITPADLAHFHGSETIYRHWTRRTVYTEGVHHLAETAACYWLLDHIAIDTRRYCSRHPFIVVKVSVKDSKAEIRAEDGNDNKIKRCRHIKYTDMPEGEWLFYLIDNHDGTATILLPSEY